MAVEFCHTTTTTETCPKQWVVPKLKSTDRLNTPEVANMHLLGDIGGRKVNHDALIHGWHDGRGTIHEDAADVCC